jgi:hypothetical protein
VPGGTRDGRATTAATLRRWLTAIHKRHARLSNFAVAVLQRDGPSRKSRCARKGRSIGTEEPEATNAPEAPASLPAHTAKAGRWSERRRQAIIRPTQCAVSIHRPASRLRGRARAIAGTWSACRSSNVPIGPDARVGVSPVQRDGAAAAAAVATQRPTSVGNRFFPPSPTSSEDGLSACHCDQSTSPGLSASPRTDRSIRRAV